MMYCSKPKRRYTNFSHHSGGLGSVESNIDDAINAPEFLALPDTDKDHAYLVHYRRLEDWFINPLDIKELLGLL
jgi:hypothetical protein